MCELSLMMCECLTILAQYNLSESEAVTHTYELEYLNRRPESPPPTSSSGIQVLVTRGRSRDPEADFDRRPGAGPAVRPGAAAAAQRQ